MGDSWDVPCTYRERLTPLSAEKQAFHLELDLKETPLRYEVGDYLAVYPINPPEIVEAVYSRWSPTAAVQRFSLERDYDLFQVSQSLQDRFGPRSYALDYLDCCTSLESFCSHLLPMKPRFYSIASAMGRVGQQAHLIVTLNRNPQGHPLEYGVCSAFLCHRVVPNETLLRIVHYPTRHFRPPAPHIPMIMIGPGTGIAPFRGFMQERTLQNIPTKNWLFFGEQTRTGHYYYSQDWETYQTQGVLEVDLAFSRESDRKIYVQDRMYAKKSELWDWIHHKQASLFVCGDAKKMAVSVESMLLSIFAEEGCFSTQEATAYLKHLRKSGRYLRDVY